MFVPGSFCVISTDHKHKICFHKSTYPKWVFKNSSHHFLGVFDEAVYHATPLECLRFEGTDRYTCDARSHYDHMYELYDKQEGHAYHLFLDPVVKKVTRYQTTLNTQLHNSSLHLSCSRFITDDKKSPAYCAIKGMKSFGPLIDSDRYYELLEELYQSYHERKDPYEA